MALTDARYVKQGMSWRQFSVRVARKLGEFAWNPQRLRSRLSGFGGRSLIESISDVVNLGVSPVKSGLRVETRTVNWVIPDFGVGSGGHLNIFRFIAHLETRGYRNRIYIEGPTHWSDAAAARTCIRDNFAPVQADLIIGVDSMAPATFTFATTWRTAYVVRAFGDTRLKCYFVQDFEPFFYARGTEYSLAEATYRFGFTGVTAGAWLAETLRADYGMQTFPLGFSYDKSLYVNEPFLPKANSRPRVFFYARPPTPRRAFDLGVLVLSRVIARRPDVEIVMAGWDLRGYSLPFPFENHGVLPHHALPKLFESCDASLVLSTTNASLLPLDLMACGCCVVSNRGPHVEWLLNDRNAVLCDENPDALAAGILDLLDDPARRVALQRSALDCARRTDWGHEGERFFDVLEQLLTGLSNGQAAGGDV